MADDYSLDDAATAGEAAVLPTPGEKLAPGDDYALSAAGAPVEPPKPPEAQASTLGYIGSRAVGGALEGAKNLGTAANLEMGQYSDADETSKLPAGQDKANQALYGTNNVPPPNAFARYAGDVASAVGSNPPAAVMAPAATLGGSVGSTGASDLNQAAGGYLPDWLARLGGGVLGGGAGAYGYLKARGALTPSAPAAPSPLDGLPANKAVTKALEQQKRFDAGESTMGAYQQPADAVAAAMGDTSTPASIGQNLMDKAGTWLAAKKADASKAFNAIEAKFTNPTSEAPAAAAAPTAPPAEGMVPPADNPKIARLAQLQSDRQAANAGLPAAGDPSRSFASIAAGPSDVAPIAPAGARVQTPATASLLTATPKEGPPLPGLFGQIQKQLADSEGSLPYPALKQWRTAVGEAIDGAQGGQGTGQLKQLYKSLTSDMEDGLRAQGGEEAVQAFRNANEGFAAQKDLISGTVGNLSDKTLTPERVFNSLAANPAQTATRLKALLDAGVIDQTDVGTIARNQITQMGKNAEGHWDPSTFTRGVAALKAQSPEAIDLLFRNSPQRAQAFDALVEKASALHTANSTLAKANAAGSGAADFFKKLVRSVTLGTVGSHVPGVGHGAGELAGTLLGLGEGGSHVSGNPLYTLPRQPVGPRVLAAPSTRATLQSLFVTPDRTASPGR